MGTASWRPAAGKLGLLGALYFSQGLPFGFFTQALPVLLRKQGYSLGQIGLTALLAMPWAFKFVWAPLVDRFGSASFGRRKSWIIPMQLLSAALLVTLALTAGARGGGLGLLLGATFLTNLLAATQDIATDGLAVDILSRRERGTANGVQVGGYRVGMIVGGGVLLIVFERAGAAAAFASMAALVLLASVPALLMREAAVARPSSGARPATALHFLRRPGAARLLLVIVTYKFGDAFATGMLRPFLADRGLTLGEIGKLLGTVGFTAGLAGALVGGALLTWLGRKNALLWFGGLQALTVAGYAYAAHGPAGRALLYGICAAEHFAGGLATVALFTSMMDWCRPGSNATDYTVQASAVVIATGVASSASGFSAQALGYFGHFVAAAILAAGTLLTISVAFPADEPRMRIGRDESRDVPSCE
jgi:PAT family beta-lactamase induction signal transducer AmpG